MMLAYVTGGGTTLADMVRHLIPLHLVPPSWIGKRPEDFGNWLVAEIETRLMLVFMLWYMGMAWISHRHFKSYRAASWVVCFAVIAVAILVALDRYLKPIKDFF